MTVHTCKNTDELITALRRNPTLTMGCGDITEQAAEKIEALRESHDRLLALLRETLSYVESEYTGHGGLDLTSTKVIARAKEAIASAEKLQEGKL